MPEKFDISKHGKKTQFKKGKSGNPAGKKKGTKSIKKTLKKLLATEINLANPLKLNDAGEPENVFASTMEHMCNAQIVQAINGNGNAFNNVVDRIEGMPDQKIQHKGKFKLDNKISMEQLHESLKKKRENKDKDTKNKENKT